MGTFVEIQAQAAPDAVAAVEAAFKAIEQVGQLMSFQDPSSDLSRLNREALTPGQIVTVHSWTYRVLEFALEMASASRGAFDPTVAVELQSWGFLPRHNPIETFGRPGDWRHVQLLPENGVRFLRPVQLDLGGVAKGFAVDRAIAALQAHGVGEALVNAGGDLRVIGESRVTIELRDPRTGGLHGQTVDLRNSAMATTAPNFTLKSRGNATRSHLVNPEDRSAFVQPVSVTVCAPDCMTADALTKAVLFGRIAADRLLEKHKAEAFILADTGVRR